MTNSKWNISWWLPLVACLTASMPALSDELMEGSVALPLPTLSGMSGIQKGAAARYHVTMTWSLKNTGFDFSRLVVILPYPQSNQYQNVSNVRVSGNGERRQARDSTNAYVRYSLAGDALPAAGTRVALGYEFDVELFEIVTPMLAEHENRAAVERDPELSPFVGQNLPFVDPKQQTIRDIAEHLWAEADGSEVAYARKAYEYVAANYRYMNPNTGVHPLSTLLAQGGGDCGNLASILVSLLRAKEIPARHLVGITPNGGNHAWAEFYTPGNGWVPVDVSAKNGNPGGDYFGHAALASAVIIFSSDLNIGVERGAGDPYTAPLLQTYLWWVQGRGSLETLQPELTVNAVPL